MRNRQRGVTAVGWLFLLTPIAIVGYAGIRLAPLYLNYMKVTRALDQVASDLKAGGGDPQGIRTSVDKHFEIDDRRVAEDARYDGLYVLRTNMRLDALAVMLRYRELLKVEDIFRTTKSILDTRPIYHQTDEAIRGHVFCSFLALVLRKALEDRLPVARLKPEWGVLLRELDRLQEIETEQEGKHFVLRTPVTGDVGRVFRALGIALPPNIREADVAALID